MKDVEVRAWYLRKVAEIPDLDREWVRRGDSLEKRAKQAWQHRHDARLKARSMMLNPADVEAIEKRDLRVYGHVDGPTFEELVDKGKQRGWSEGETYRWIIRAAQATNGEVDRAFVPPESPPPAGA
jgi:hypothetical protein